MEFDLVFAKKILSHEALLQVKYLLAEFHYDLLKAQEALDAFFHQKPEEEESELNLFSTNGSL